MPTITGIVPAPDRPGHVVILVDGRPFATVPAEAAPQFARSARGTLPSCAVRELVPQAEPAAPTSEATEGAEPRVAAERPAGKTYERALSLLAFRARSAKELAKRLREKGEPPEAIDAALARLAAAGLIDDARYAEGRARSAIVGKARSKRRIEQDLVQRGVDREVAGEAVRRVLADEGTDEAKVAEQAARKKLRSLAKLEPAEQKQKLMAYLARQGHGAEVARRAVRAVMEEAEGGGARGA